MPTAKQRTDSELAAITATAVAHAVEFTATIRAAHPKTGISQNFTLRRPTLVAARDVARRLEIGFANGRKALVYAVQSNGSAHLVPSDF